jgi:signal transduction histidine kinase
VEANQWAMEFPSRGKILMIDDNLSLRRVWHRHTQSELMEVETMAAIGRMVCSISHDLRHSLSAIYANAEFLERPDMCASERSELLQAVQQAVHMMTELIDSLLQFGHTGKTSHLVHEQVSSIIENAVAAVKNHPDVKGVPITFEMFPGVKADIDSRKLESAVYNLLLNACQAAAHSTDAPEVNVYLDEVGDWIYITIVDNGPGVSTSIKKTLFDPFVTQGKHNGTGLGLTLARRIAEEHGGSVCLNDSDGDRTVFTLSLTKHRLQM